MPGMRLHVPRCVPWTLLLLAAGCSAGEKRAVPAIGYRTWEVYGGGKDGIRYSALRQINRDNVHRLEVAWTFDTGDAFQGSEMQCNPIVVDGTLYATTPKLRLIALDAAAGTLRWSFDPFSGRDVRRKQRNRGVAYWSDGADQRVFVTAEHFLWAIDARTGQPVRAFGEGGRVDMRRGLGRDPAPRNVSATSPGTVYQDLLILGSRVAESLPAAPGHVRAWDVRTGELRWTFRTIPRPEEFGHDTWPPDAWQYIGGANCWSGMALDEERGLVFVPTGSAAFDFYGANRVGDNLFANSLVCLRAATGQRVWHFQVVKHDVWDRDLPAPPSLVRVQRQGVLIDAVAQITKSGHVFVFERDTGRPLFPIEYRDVPPSDIDGEKLARTQPLPLKPPPFARQAFTEEIATKRTPAAHGAVLARLRQLRATGQFDPPSREGTVVFPGFDGGGEWGGAACDPETGLIYVNSNEMAWVLRLVERKVFGKTTGSALYAKYCAACHREDRRGTPPEFPSLENLGARYTRDELAKLTHEGGGRMPAFTRLSAAERGAIADYLLSGKVVRVAATMASSPIDLAFGNDGYNKFLDPDGFPAVEPPWGTLNAIDLDAGELVWQIPLGQMPSLVEQGLPNTGCENYGGPVVTAGGLLFIGATNHDRKFRAFDKATGELLWETTLPAAGNATPAIYEVEGRQFVVIAAGGGKWGLPSGGTYVAFSLPWQ